MRTNTPDALPANPQGAGRGRTQPKRSRALCHNTHHDHNQPTDGPSTSPRPAMFWPQGWVPGTSQDRIAIQGAWHQEPEKN
eukprot:1827627-Alexandrium_andersonii.AAC.1